MDTCRKRRSASGEAGQCSKRAKVKPAVVVAERGQDVVRQAADAAIAEHPEPSAPLAGIHFILDEQKSEADRTWVQKRHEANDRLIREATCTFPSWQIVSGKWIRLEYTFSTGDVTVVMEQHPNSRGKFTGARLTLRQWKEFSVLVPCILDYVEASEGRGNCSWSKLSSVWSKPPPSEKGGISTVKIHVCDDLYVTVTTFPGKNQGCKVDLRYFVHSSADNALIAIASGLTLVGGGFHFFAKQICPKVEAALTMYGRIHEATVAVFDECLHTPVDHAKEHEDLMRLPEPFYGCA
jgi:hypothetical protein